jgi:hypothetical protein
MKSKVNKLTETERVLKFIKDYKALSPINKEILKSIADDKLKKLKPNFKKEG